MQTPILDAAAVRITERKGCGNDGPVEGMEKQKQLSHASHRPLEISQKARDSHIPTAWHRGPGKVENQKQVSHFPTAARNDCPCSLNEKKLKTKERRSAATRPPLPRFRYSHLN
jgi:hypothetical protein